MQRALGASLLLHIIVLAFFAVQLPTFKKPEDKVISVRLMAAPPPRTQPKEVTEKPTKPPKPVRTQASAAPKEPPTPKTQETISNPDRMKVAAKKKPKELEKPKAKLEELPKETPKAEETAQKRPPKLDKTPDKKIVQSADKDAKTVTDPDDFLAALEFIDQLADKVEPSAPTPEEKTTETVVEYSIADLAETDGIKRHIEDNWLRPPGLKADELTAIVVVKLNADGTVKSTKIEQSSGEVFYDNSLIRAIHKASPLPIPAAKYEKFSVLELYFKG